MSKLFKKIIGIIQITVLGILTLFNIFKFTKLSRRFKKDRNSVTVKQAYYVIREIFSPFDKFHKGPVEIRGKEHLPPEDELVLYMGNHAGIYDAVIPPLYFPGVVAGVLAEEWWSKSFPVLKELIQMNDTILVNRRNLRDQLRTFKISRQAFGNGRSVVIFPEGKITNFYVDKYTGSFKAGSIKYAQTNKVKIIPFATYGVENVYNVNKPGNSKVIMSRKQKIIYEFLPPVNAHLEPNSSRTDIIKDIENAVISKMKELRSEQNGKVTR